MLLRSGFAFAFTRVKMRLDAVSSSAQVVRLQVLLGFRPLGRYYHRHYSKAWRRRFCIAIAENLATRSKQSSVFIAKLSDTRQKTID